jgi:hypothetical protein
MQRTLTAWRVARPDREADASGSTTAPSANWLTNAKSAARKPNLDATPTPRDERNVIGTRA